MSKTTRELTAPKPKRIRRDPETTRKLILDAAEDIMVADGYAAVTSRRVAERLGLNAATIHYYYPTTDDLFLAIHERMSKRQLADLAGVQSAADPLEAMWNYLSTGTQSALGVELIALANHRKSLHAVLAEKAEEARDLQARALESSLRGLPEASAVPPPIALATILLAIARTLTNEERVGITRGHAEVREFVTRVLADLPRSRAESHGEPLPGDAAR